MESKEKSVIDINTLTVFLVEDCPGNEEFAKHLLGYNKRINQKEETVSDKGG